MAIKEARRTLKSDPNQPVCFVFFVYENDKLLIGAEGYLSRSSPRLGKGTQSLRPSDRPHFRRRRRIFLSGGAEMKGWYLALAASSAQETGQGRFL